MIRIIKENNEAVVFFQVVQRSRENNGVEEEGDIYKNFHREALHDYYS
jgi:hypothetical protein